MSKCKPKQGPAMALLSSAGVFLTDEVEEVNGQPQRIVSVKVPYEALRDNAEVQKAFAGLVTLHIEDVATVAA